MNISSLNSVSVNSNAFSSRVGMATNMLGASASGVARSAASTGKGSKVVTWILENGKKVKDGVKTFFTEGFGKKVIDFFKKGFKAVKNFFTPKKSTPAA